MERKSRGGKTGNDAKASAGTQICPNCKKLFKRLGQHRCQLSSATTPVKKEKKLDAKKTDTKASVERQRDRETRAKTAEEQRFDGQRSALTTRLQHEGSINSDSQGGARPKVNAGQPLSIPPLSSTERRGSKRNPKPPSNPLRGSHGREPTTPEKKEPPAVAGLEAPDDKKKTDTKARAVWFLWSLSAKFSYFKKIILQMLYKRQKGEGSINADSQGGARPKVKEEQSLFRPPLSSTERRGSRRNPNPPSNPLRGSHGREPVLDVTALTEEAEEVMEKLKLEANPNPVHYNTTFFDDQVKVKRHEKEAVLGAFNPFRGRIKRSLNESTEWKWKDFNSGSTYDGTKVCITDYCLLLL